MRTHITIWIFLLALLPFIANAQQGERVEAMKVAFITKKLNLTPTEAQSFWPIYNAHQDQMKKIRMDRVMERMESQGSWDQLSDKEIEETMANFIALKEREVQLQRKYYEDLKKVLPIRKVGLLFKAEEEFRRAILEAIRDRRMEGGGPAGRRMNGGGF